LTLLPDQLEQINFTEVGSDAQVAPSTVRDYYQILTDTLIGELLPAFTKQKRERRCPPLNFICLIVALPIR